jgi:hypothetical protein
MAFPARLDFQELAWTQTSVLISICHLKCKPTAQSVPHTALFTPKRSATNHLVSMVFSSHVGLPRQSGARPERARRSVWQEKRKVKKSLSFLIRGLLLSQTGV